MPARHLRSTRSVRGARRKLVWATTAQNFTIAAGARTTVDLLASLEVAGASTLGVTVMRTHSRIYVSNWATVNDEVVYGFIIARDTDIGAALGPNANADTELDWMLWSALFPTSSAAAVDVTSMTDIDLRAKRKMEEMGQRYALCVTNISAASKTFSLIQRTLVALP
jgi:hypothetical protein